MKETINYLQKAKVHLPESGTIFSENAGRVEMRIVRGYKQRGRGDLRGVYELIEERRGENTVLILTHDTLSDPAVRGAIIENRNIAKTIGLESVSKDMTGRAVEDLFNGFNACENYSHLSKDNQTGVHYS